MKVFILGAEGAGKTVFITMLSRYLASLQKDLVLEPSDYETSKYVVESMATLERGEWPASTRIGPPIALHWNFRAADRAPRHVLMYDTAGQDLRTLLLTESLAAADQKEDAEQVVRRTVDIDYLDLCRTQIAHANVLIYLLDLESLIAAKDAHAHNEACWLLKAFVSHPQWRGKRRLVLLTKIDKYGDLLAQCEGDVCKCVQMHLPKFYGIDNLCRQQGISYAAISSVATETIVEPESGIPRRIPAKSLQPGDMSCVIECLCGEALLEPKIIAKHCDGFVFARLCIHPNLPSDKLERAISSFASAVAPRDVLALVDTTVFGTATEGLLLTATSVYWRNSGQQPNQRHYCEMSNVRHTPTNSIFSSAKIHVDDQAIEVRCGSLADQNRIAQSLAAVISSVLSMDSHATLNSVSTHERRGTIVGNCPSCGRGFAAAASNRGVTIACMACETRFVIGTRGC